MRAKQYIPPYVDYRDEVPEFEECTFEDLMEKDWVARRRHLRARNGTPFLRFSRIDEGVHHTLMAEYGDDESKPGSEWWVIGFVVSPDEQFLALPLWKAGR